MVNDDASCREGAQRNMEVRELPGIELGTAVLRRSTGICPDLSRQDPQRLISYPAAVFFTFQEVASH